jgi:pimeloyl-ACP methyl ester carboxylesterase
MGEGSPTIILTAGAGDFSASAWGKIQPEMAKITRTCAWDRTGFGLSDGTMAPVTVGQTTADLEAALATGAIPGPYVMVGHSLGSYESLLFTDRHPDMVVGMVLVDPSIPNQFARLRPPGQPVPDLTKDPTAQRLQTCAGDIRAGTAKADGPDPNGCFAYAPTWPPAFRQALIKALSNPVQYEARASFGENIFVDAQQVINPTRNYRDMPLIVLSAGARLVLPPGAPPLTDDQKRQLTQEADFNRGQAELAALSTRGVITPVPDANHYIQLSKPQVVLDAVAKVVGEARASSR